MYWPYAANHRKLGYKILSNSTNVTVTFSFLHDLIE